MAYYINHNANQTTSALGGIASVDFVLKTDDITYAGVVIELRVEARTDKRYILTESAVTFALTTDYRPFFSKF